MFSRITVKHTALLLALLLLLGLFAACGSPSSSPSSSPSPSPTGAPEPSAAPSSTDAPESPAPGGAGQPTDEDHLGMLPAPEVGSREFVEEFLRNPIDAQFEEDMALASSVAEMVSVCSDVSELWQTQIASAYAQLTSDDVPEDVAERIAESQVKWLEEQDAALAAIRDAVEEGDTMAPLTSAEQTMLYFRARAIELCAEMYEQTGSVSFG